MSFARSVCTLTGLLLALAWPSNGNATSDAALCDRAAVIAATRTGVPETILSTITRVETGRTEAGVTVPWPWAAHMSGSGYWFATEGEAVTAIHSALAAGNSNIDVGCFQLNYHWHGTAFRDLTAMMDPVQNAVYAAEFLAELYGEFGDWDAAVGAYHSRTDQHARRYLTRYHQVAAALNGPPNQGTPIVAAAPLQLGSGSDERVHFFSRPPLWTSAQVGLARPLTSASRTPLWEAAP